MRKNRFLPGGGQNIYLLILLFLIYSTVYMSKSIFTSAMAGIVEAGIMTKTQTGAISAAYWLFYAVFQIPGGLAADKFKPAHLITLGMVGAIAATLVIYFFPIYEVIIVAWVFNAIVQFGLWPSVFKIATTQMRPDMRKTAMFWLVFGTTFGFGGSLLLASYMTHWLQNFQTSVVILGSVLLLWLVSYPVLEKKMIEEDVPLPKMPNGTAPEKVGWKEMFKTGVWGLAIAAFLRTMVENGIKMLTPTMLMESYTGLPASISTRLSVILAIFSFGGAILLKYFQKYITDNEAKGVAIILIIVIPLVAVVSLVGKIHYWWVLGLLCLILLFSGCIGPMTNSFCAGRFAKWGKSGTVAGFNNALAALGNVGASYGLTIIAEKASWSSVMWVCCGLLVITAIACVIIQKSWTKFIEE